VYDRAAMEKQWQNRDATRSLFTAVRDILTGVPDWSTDALEAALRELAEKHGVAAGKIFQPLRVALTGLTVSPGIFDVLLMLGRDRSVSRISTAIGLTSNEGPY
jgi:glutamyl-tRNA synthetase